MIIKRFSENPILKPNNQQSWEASAVFNGCLVKNEKKSYLIYRAISMFHYHAFGNIELMVSNIGIAEGRSGKKFNNRRRFIVPEHKWEKFGCEDPRAVKLNGKYFIFYTALSNWPPRAEDIKVAVAISKDLKTIQEKHLVTPFNAKAMALFPEKINGKIWAILTANTDKPPSRICLASFNQEEDMWDKKYWNKWYENHENYSLPLQRGIQDHIETGAAPIKTRHGWLIFYSYIRNYFSPYRLFTVEAALLDLNDPSKIIAKVDFPVLSPEEYYEKYGMSPNIVFPSGAVIEGDWVNLYYGAADTTCCMAKIELNSLMEQLLNKNKKIVKLSRAKENPIITPNPDNPWEAKATFNPAAIYLDGKVHLLYRAMSEDNTSVFGYANSKDGINIDYRASEPVYVPREEYEQKLVPGGNSGVEDPRLEKIKDKIYMFYTAFDGKNSPRVALSSISQQDFVNNNWNWSKSVLISPPYLANKDAAIFPEKINGEFLIIHRNGDDIDLSFNKSLDFTGKEWLEEYRWIMKRKGWWDSAKVGLASPPFKTKEGWVVLYHGISEDDGAYRVGAVLTSLSNPVKIIGRTDYPIFEPEALYEKEGQVANVVFPCGSVLINKKLFVYYGGADKVVGVATIHIDDLLKVLKLCRC